MTTADQTWLEPAIDQKIYRNQVIRVATFLGGPLCSGLYDCPKLQGF
nr:hypothetical protein [Mucilaginibacter sp. SP1R1]